MESLDRLNSKVDALLKKHAATEAENIRLKEIIAGQNQTIATLSRKLSSLEQNMVSVHLGKAVVDEDEKINMREQLDNVISEIDKILHTLND